MKTNLTRHLLFKNISASRITAFVISNFLGLAIVLSAIQFYVDSKSLWEDEDSFIRSDYLVVNKKITSENTMHGNSSGFSTAELEDLKRQPWVRKFAPFSSADYKIMASIIQGNRGMSTNMFFESIPAEYVDIPSSQWGWREGMDEIPVVISKDYLSLYNFGFASSAGLPQLSEGLMSGIPLSFTLQSEDGMKSETFHGRIAGFSNRLNTILVPQEFMDWSNVKFGRGVKVQPSRLIIEVSSPGDTAIKRYLESNDLETAGDKNAASASFLLKIVVGIVMGIGIVITVLSLFILLLSISLILEKNRSQIHRLIMLGYDLKVIESPYRFIAVSSSVVALLLAMGAVIVLRTQYIGALTGFGIEKGNLVLSGLTGCVLTAFVILFNILLINRKVKESFR